MTLIYEKALRKALLSTFIVLSSLASFSDTYYVSSEGSDANSGLSTSLPWKTLGKVNATTFIPGDQILFKKGDTFYGSLTIGQSGTSVSRIVYGAYGTGANPNITGFTSVTSWTNLGGNIWESANAVSGLSDLNLVVINGVNTGMGRTPNTGYYYFKTHSGKTSINSKNLTGTPNWANAELAFNNTLYTVARVPITSQSDTTLFFNESSLVPYISDSKGGQQFIIQNDIRCCDVQNEWYYNPSTKKLKIYSTSQPSNVQVSTVDQLIGVNASYITLENLSIMGSNARSINVGGSSITIQNCNIAYSGTDAVDGTWNAAGSNILITNCTITESNHGGIAFTRFFSNVTISSNTITNSAMIYGASAKASMYNNATINYGMSIHCTNTLIELNHVENSGYIGISTFGMVDQIIQKNFVKTFCVHSHDGGGIYTWNGTVKTAFNKGMKILNNIVIGNSADGTAGDADADAGIYLDDYSNSVEVADNIVTGNQFGIFLHDTHDIVVQRNTTFDNDKGFRIYGEAGIPMNNITSNNNIYVAKGGGQWAMHLDPLETILPTFTASNNIYARPINDTNPIGGYNRSPLSGIAKSVSQWQTYSGQDANSSKSHQSITSESEMRYEYNETKDAKKISLSQPMMDMRGVKYTGSITLQPHKSVVLIKDVTSASVPGAPTSVVANAGNASASITFAVPTSNGGSAITGYTITSRPTGGVDASAGSNSLIRTITGLTNGTPYTFTVRATNSVGTSVSSAPSKSVTPKAPLIATSFAFTGPSSGNENSASSNFTVTPNKPYTGTITITPSGSGSTGLTTIILNFSNSSTAQTFMITPNVAGTVILTPSNGGSLKNPASLTYTSQVVVPDVLSENDNVGVTDYLPSTESIFVKHVNLLTQETKTWEVKSDNTDFPDSNFVPGLDGSNRIQILGENELKSLDLVEKITGNPQPERTTLYNNTTNEINCDTLLVENSLATNYISGKIITSAEYSGEKYCLLMQYRDNNLGTLYDIVEVDENLNFEFENIFTGKYIIVYVPSKSNNLFTPPTYFNQTPYWENATVIELGLSDTVRNVNINRIELPPLNGNKTISGNLSIMEAKAATVENEDFFADVSIIVENPQDQSIFGFCYTGNNGFYQLKNLTDGSYDILIVKPGYMLEKKHSIVITSEMEEVENLNFVFNADSTIQATYTTNSPLKLSKNVSFVIYPNPTSNVFNIKTNLADHQLMSIKIYNNYGQVVKTIETKNFNTTSIDVKSLPAGIYYIIVATIDNNYSKILFKK